MQIFSLEQFEGPLDLLLQMIENERLNISEISLATICDQYVQYVQERERDITMDELADFLLIAARLLQLKTRILLPYLYPEEDEDVPIEIQLKMFKLYRGAAEELAKLDRAMQWSFERHVPRKIVKKQFYPDANITPQSMSELFTSVIGKLPFIRLPQEVLRKTLNIKQRIEEVRTLFQQARTSSFLEITRTAETKHDIIVWFIALLELVKRQELILDQSGLCEDIIIKRID